MGEHEQEQEYEQESEDDRSTRDGFVTALEQLVRETTSGGVDVEGAYPVWDDEDRLSGWDVVVTRVERR